VSGAVSAEEEEEAEAAAAEQLERDAAAETRRDVLRLSRYRGLTRDALGVEADAGDAAAMSRVVVCCSSVLTPDTYNRSAEVFP